MITALLILGWLACGVAACGLHFAHTLHHFRHESDIIKHAKTMALIHIILGCVALLISFDLNRGWLWPWSAKAKREAGL